MVGGTARGPIQQATERIRGWLRLARGEQLSRERNLRIEEFHRELARITHELYDTLLQGFLRPSLVLAGTLEQLPTDSLSKPSLSRVLRLMHRVIEEGRVVLQGLQLPMTVPGSLEQEFSDLVEEFAPTGRATFRILVLGRPKALEPAIQEQMYLLGREALLNALRYSNATNIEAEVCYLPRQLRVVVRDNGSGIDPQVLLSGPDSNGGLLRMHERAGPIGAQLSIWTRNGAGTEVEICLPLKGMSELG